MGSASVGAIGARLLVASSIAAAASTVACNAGPGASGTISLGPEIDAAAFQTLAVRAYANREGGFDPSQPIPAQALVLDFALTTVSFPLDYGIGSGSGETNVASWQLAAWLSHRRPGDIPGIDSGDVYCARPFEADDCGRSDDACFLTPMVDCILATVAP